MLKLISGADTRQSPTGKLILRTRRYEADGEVYNLIKDLRTGKYTLTIFCNPENFLRGVITIFVNREAKWGAGLSWKQAEKRAEKIIQELSFKK